MWNLIWKVLQAKARKTIEKGKKPRRVRLLVFLPTPVVTAQEAMILN